MRFTSHSTARPLQFGNRPSRSFVSMNRSRRYCGLNFGMAEVLSGGGHVSSGVVWGRAGFAGFARLRLGERVFGSGGRVICGSGCNVRRFPSDTLVWYCSSTETWEPYMRHANASLIVTETTGRIHPALRAAMADRTGRGYPGGHLLGGDGERRGPGVGSSCLKREFSQEKQKGHFP